MGRAFILLLVLLAAIYFFSIRKMKKNRAKLEQMNSVQDFHDSYGHLSGKVKPHKRTEGRNNYVTKYNSSEDYREK